MSNLDQYLKNIVTYAYNNVKSYREKMLNAGIKPDDIQRIENMNLLPYMDKEDFRKNYPYGLFAVPLDKIIRVHSTSGTTGMPSIVGFTEKDWNLQKKMTSKIAELAGITAKDIVQIVYGFGMFTGGIGWLEGLENINALVIPSGSGNSQRQIEYMKNLKTTTLIGTPSYIMYLSELASQLNVKKSELNVKNILVGGEIMNEEVREIIKDLWKTESVTQNYGFCEGGGAGISGECIYQSGLHISPYYYPEVIDPQTLKRLPLGSTGELVFTTFNKEGLPLIRYRTHDIATLTFEKCQCGIEGYKMSRIIGRTDEMLKIKGVCVYPSVIESLFLNNEICTPNYEMVLTTHNYLDDFAIRIELKEPLSSYSYDYLLQVKGSLQQNIKNKIGINIDIEFVNPNTLDRYEGKSHKVKDLRLSRSR